MADIAAEEDVVRTKKRAAQLGVVLKLLSAAQKFRAVANILSAALKAVRPAVVQQTLLSAVPNRVAVAQKASLHVCCGSRCCKAGATSAEESIEMFIDMTTTVITTTTTNDKNPFVDFPVFSALPGPCNTLDVEIQNEGNYSCMYKDKENHPTIGIGCNLDKKGARKELEGVGADYNAVLNGSQCLNAAHFN